jgi:WD40 repeat protein
MRANIHLYANAHAYDQVMSLAQRECCGYRITLSDLVLEDVTSAKHAHHVVSCTHMQSNDGQLVIALSSGAVVLWDIRSKKVVKRFLGGSNSVLHVAVPSPGGKYVAAGYDCGQIAVWLVEREKAPAFMCVHTRDSGAACCCVFVML